MPNNIKKPPIVVNDQSNMQYMPEMGKELVAVINDAIGAEVMAVEWNNDRLAPKLRFGITPHGRTDAVYMSSVQFSMIEVNGEADAMQALAAKIMTGAITAMSEVIIPILAMIDTQWRGKSMLVPAEINAAIDNVMTQLNDVMLGKDRSLSSSETQAEHWIEMHGEVHEPATTTNIVMMIPNVIATEYGLATNKPRACIAGIAEAVIHIFTALMMQAYTDSQEAHELAPSQSEVLLPALVNELNAETKPH